MNFVSKFDGSLAFTGTHPKAQLQVETVHTRAPSDAIVVKDANLLFNGDFKRTGLDLVISRDDQELVLPDYFKGDKRAALASSDGAYLTGKTIEVLTGHVQVAQADGSAAAAKIIGHVTKLSGSATVVRNGVSIVLNNGDTVYQGDVVQSGSNSTVGITFIDGSVFGLASNARMVLNEMVYDPNGSGNSSFLSLVQGTISFVAGATAKHGDMKVDTPVATMGIRGTAVLVEIDFEVTVPGTAPPARFQVLVEPDGTTGSYVLLDRVTLAPLATVSQPGTVTTVSGAGAVSFLASAQLSPELMKLISEVFSQKFTDNTNPKSNTNFTDTVIPQTTFPVQLAGGETVTATVTVIAASEAPGGSTISQPKAPDRIPGPPGVVTFNQLLAERPALTGSSLIDKVSGNVSYTDINPGDVPTVSTAFSSFAYASATGVNMTASLTATQLGAIAAVSVPLTVVQDPAAKNNGTAVWTYNVQDHALDFLAQGEKLTLTYMARVDNNFAPANEFSFAPFTITITGTNDTPTIESPAQTAEIEELEGEVDSDTLDTATGTIEFEDVDLTDTHSVSITGVVASGVVSGLPGTGGGPGAAAAPSNPLYWLSLGDFVDSTDGETGSRVWTFSAEDHYFDYLAEGETLTLTYTVEVKDNNGATVTQDVVVTVTGSNDDPIVATADVTGGVTELVTPVGDLTDTGTIAFTDVDLSDTHTISPTITASLGALGSLTASVTTDTTGSGLGGVVTWDYSVEASYVEYLAAGETKVESFTITLDDGNGGLIERTIDVTITGTNDAPVVAAEDVTGGVTELVTPAGDLTDTGTIAFTDVDLTDTHTISPTITASAGALGSLTASVTTDTTGTGLGGVVTWGYTVAASAVEYLAEGETKVESFTITLDDGNGGLIERTIEVTITGTNDDPVVAVEDVTGEVTELVTPAGDLTDTGTIAFTDVDLTDTHTISPTITASAGALGSLTASVTTDTTGTGLGGVVTWNYTVAASAVEYLAEGETKVETFTITLDDGNGGLIERTISVTITGTNDDPVVAVEDVTGEVTELVTSAGDLTDTGTIAFTDVDLIDIHSITPPAGALGSLTASVTTDTTGSGLGGVVTWNYTVAASAVEYLAEGETKVESFTITLDDGNGGLIERTIDVTITGTNDAPVVAAEDVTGGVTELVTPAGDLTDTGTIAFTDVDLTDTHTISPTITASAGALGSLTASVTTDTTGTGLGGVVTWNYTVAASAVEYLAADETKVESFTITLDDGNGGLIERTIDVTITGTNDAPVVAAEDVTGGVTELVTPAGDLTDTGTIAFTDVDLTDTHTISPTITASAGALGSLTASVTTDTTGTGLGGVVTWDYTLAASAVEYLAAGETKVESFTITLDDGNGSLIERTISVTITGTNDAPAITSNSGGATASVSIAENTTAVTTVQATDVDNTGLTYSIVTGDDSPDAERFTINATTGELSFTDPPNYEAPGSAAGSNFYTVQVQVSDGAGGVDVQTLIVEVTDSGETLQAISDTVFTNVDTPITLSTLTANDTSSGTVSPQIVSVYNAKNGTVALNNGAPVFTPDPGFTGTASFSYWISETPDPTPPGTFAATVNYGMGAFPQAVTLADINDDGILDMLTSNYTSNTISFRYGNGDGSFESSLHQLTAGANPSTPIVVADFNNDGNMDLAVGNFGTDNISIFYSNGNGGYNAAINYAAGDGPEGLTGADVNGDGNVDLIVSNYNAGTVSVTLSNGNGTFQNPVAYAVGGTAGSLPYLSALADLDGDGNLDIVVGNAGSSNISVLIGSIDGTFEAAVNYTTPAGSNAVAIGDVNGDGILDIVSSNGTVSVFLGNGDGSFQPETSYAAGGRTKGIALADFDEDGDLDIVVANSRDPALDPNPQTNSVSILLNNGNGTFGAPVSYATGWDTYGVAVADLNGDGRPDIVAPNEIDGTASVLLNALPGGALSSTMVTVNVVQTTGALQLVGHALLGGSGNQAASSVEYVDGHLYLTYNGPVTQTTSDYSNVVSFSTAVSAAPTQEFSLAWTKGFFNGVGSDGVNIYAVGASHPGTGLTSDGSGGAEVKTLLATFNASGTAGTNPSFAPATDYAATNFFSYRGVEIFYDVLATEQNGNTVLYAVGFGQPASYGAYVIAAYDENGNLLHSAVDPLAFSLPGFSVAYEAVEFNNQIWAIGYNQHPTGRATVWAASYDLSTVVTYENTLETNPASFNGAAVIGSNLYAVGYSVSASNGNQYLIAKYNTDGSVAWSTSFGDAGDDVLTGAVSINGHLYVVGYTTDASGNTDGVLMEISTVNGSVISTTSYGGALYDAFNSITTDGYYLYVAGESKSFTSGGNGVGEGDAILLTFDPGLGPVINTEAFNVAEVGNISTVTGLSIASTSAGQVYTVTAETAAAPGSTVTLPSTSGSLAQINFALETTGITYDPGTGPVDTDMVTFTVTDELGNSDIVNFIFNEGGTGPTVTLTGTPEKDVIFATGYDDVLTGGAKADQFVFTPEDSPSEDIIMDFTLGEDRIDLRAFTGLDTSNIEDWLEENVSQDGADTVITLDDDTTITLTNVSATSLSASNFIVSQYQQLGM